MIAIRTPEIFGKQYLFCLLIRPLKHCFSNTVLIDSLHYKNISHISTDLSIVWKHARETNINIRSRSCIWCMLKSLHIYEDMI